VNNPNRAKAIVYAAALFVVGGVCGVEVAPRLFPPPAPVVSQPLKLGRTNEIAQKIQAKLQQRLNLTTDQLAKAAPLIETASQKLEEAHLDCLNQIEAVVAELHKQLKPLLTEQQLSALKILEKERADTMAQNYNYPPAVTNLTGH
jgi:hypothetical protein